MRVLIACEYSGITRDAFSAKGHEAWSCDYLPSEQPGKHYQGNVLDILYTGWDLLIAHPPCTHLAVSGARWFRDPRYKDKLRQQANAVHFVKTLFDSPIKKVCIENPVGVLSTKWQKPDQIIDPIDFYHANQKKTCLWLKGLPLLRPPSFKDVPKIHEIDREHLSYAHTKIRNQKERSRSFENVAFAMADQWG